MKKRSFTDKLYVFNLVFSWLFIAICIALTVFSGYLNITDLSIVNVGIPTIFAELSVHTGFVIWKAKVENCRKFKDVNLLNELESEVENEY
jgi:hypothetical protein